MRRRTPGIKVETSKVIKVVYEGAQARLQENREVCLYTGREWLMVQPEMVEPLFAVIDALRGEMEDQAE